MRERKHTLRSGNNKKGSQWLGREEAGTPGKRDVAHKWDRCGAMGGYSLVRQPVPRPGLEGGHGDKGTSWQSAAGTGGIGGGAVRAVFALFGGARKTPMPALPRRFVNRSDRT